MSLFFFSAKILISEILPRKQNGFRTYTDSFITGYNDIAQRVNTTIEEVCALFSWLDFVKFPGFGHEHLSKDGLHLSFKGTEMVANRIEQCILSHKHQPSSTSPESTELVPVECVNDEEHVNGIVGPLLYSDMLKKPLTNSDAMNPEKSSVTLDPFEQHHAVTSQTMSHSVQPSAPSRRNKEDRKRTRKDDINQKRPKHVPRHSAKEKKCGSTAQPKRESSDSGQNLVKESGNSDVPVNMFEVLFVEECCPGANVEDTCAKPVNTKKTFHNRSQRQNKLEVIELSNRFVLSTDKISITGRGFENIVYKHSDDVLSWTEAKKILDDPDTACVTTVPPYKPKAGEVYVFSTVGDEKKIDDWKADQYMWINYGGYGCPKSQNSFWTKLFKFSTGVQDKTAVKNFREKHLCIETDLIIHIF